MLMLYTYKISIKTYWNNCKTSSRKKSRSSFSSDGENGGSVGTVEVLMEYFSDTNVCLVCSQIQSISRQQRIFMQKCILYLTSNALGMEMFDRMLL